MKENMIEATTIDKSPRYQYMDFYYDGIGYRYDARTEKFSKLYYLPGDRAVAVRGKKRAVILSLVKEMYKYNLKFAIITGV